MYWLWVVAVVLCHSSFDYIKGNQQLKKQIHPVFNTIKLDTTLHGLMVTESGSGGVPFQTNIEVRKGLYSWYDEVVKADEHFAVGEYDMAIKTYERVLSIQSLPELYKPAVVLSLSRSLVAVNRLFEACPLIELAIPLAKSEKFRTFLWFQLGLYLHMGCNFSQAEIAYRRALELNPNYADALNHLAVLRLVTGDIDEFHYYFLEFIRIQTKLAEERRLNVYSEGKRSYRSTFQVKNVKEEAAIWLVNHVMRSFDLDGAPSILSASSLNPELAKRMQLEGYYPGAFEANVVLAYSVYQNSFIENNSGDQGSLSQLFHYNLAKRLSSRGASKEASWHFTYATSLGTTMERDSFLSLRAALEIPDVVPPGNVDTCLNQIEERKHQLQEVTLKCSEAASWKYSTHLCFHLGKDIFSARSNYLEPFDSHVQKAIEACCTNVEREICKARVDVKHPSEIHRVGIVFSKLGNGTGGQFLSIMTTAMSSVDLDVQLFTWPDERNSFFKQFEHGHERDVHMLSPESPDDSRQQLVNAELDVLVFVDISRDIRLFLLSGLCLPYIQLSLRLSTQEGQFEYGGPSVNLLPGYELESTTLFELLAKRV
mmetsp:Transcript_22689/g.49330  ORF Transcript_22689/g.49330 Transcript_22689/m.49330 type:complete len:597 (+) Transcript_22689:500-2290(+)